MLVKNIMSEPVICCTPWDSVRYAAALMAFHSVGALSVVSDLNDPLLEGIVTDPDLCSRVLAVEDRPRDTRVVDVMTPVPVTCEPHDDLNKCLERMRRHQLRRIPVVNGRGRCVGIVALADVAPAASPGDVAQTLREISKRSRPQPQAQPTERYYYCGELHELDQIALLERRRSEEIPEEVLP